MAPDGTAPKRQRTSGRRISADEKRQRVTDGVEVNLTAAGKLVVLAAEGLVNRRERERAKQCLDVWEKLLDIALPEVPAAAPAVAPEAPQLVS